MTGRIRPMAFKPDGRESYMTTIGIEALVRDVDNVPERERFFEDDEPEWSFEYITHEQAPVEAAIAMGHD